MQRASRWLPTAGRSAGYQRSQGCRRGCILAHRLPFVRRTPEVASHRKWFPVCSGGCTQGSNTLQVSGRGLGAPHPGILSPGTRWRTSQTAEVCRVLGGQCWVRWNTLGRTWCGRTKSVQLHGEAGLVHEKSSFQVMEEKVLMKVFGPII